jgi:hypothetical protein
MQGILAIAALITTLFLGIQFDAYLIGKRLEKLNNYSLKEFCDKVLKDGTKKLDMPYNEIAPDWADDPTVTNAVKRQKRSRINRYCSGDVNATRRLIAKRSYITLMMKIGQLSNTNMMDIQLRGVTQQSWHMVQDKVCNYAGHRSAGHFGKNPLNFLIDVPEKHCFQVYNAGWYINEASRRFFQSCYGIGKCPYCPSGAQCMYLSRA